MTAFDTTAPSSPTLSAAARRFLEPPRFAIVATLNPDGSPLQAVVWYRLEGDSVVFNSKVGRRWPSNLRRDRRASITVADGYDYIELCGEVEIDDDPEIGQAVIAALTHRYQRDGKVAEAEIADFATQRRVTFRLRPGRVFERLPGN
ncbi:MAG: TIGR03618 family F420-dependent PPOX class oxidoreductase [Candidatus Limnocylindrales bacterium]|jgi:PPOX class probable F420-dependent enzyme